MTDQIIVNAPLIQTVEIAQQSGALSVGNQSEQIVVSAPLVQSVSVASESVSVVTSGGPAAVAIFQGEGSSGLVPDPGIGDDDRVLLADGTWAAQSGSGGGGSDDQVAAEVPFTPTGDIAATDVQAAIEELDSEKAASIHQHSLSAITDAGALAAEDTVSSALVDDESITDAKLAHVATSTLKGRATTGTGDVETLSASQVRSILNIEDGAAADQTGAEIKSLYEAEADTNAFTDAEKAQLAVAGLTAQVYNSGAQSLLGSLGIVTLELDTSLSMDSGFSLTTSYELDCAFAGRVRISYHITGNDDSGLITDRSHSNFWVERQPDGGSYSTVVGTQTSVYHRNTRNGGNAACLGTILTVAENDKLRVRWDVGGNGNVVQIPAQHAVFTIERI